jgi:osmotically-inducible protein OsmY
MTKSKYIGVMSFALALSGLLSGCALERAFADDPEDPEITAAVDALIRQHPDLNTPNTLYVSTRNHVVYLSGLVDSGLVTEEAEALARQVPGVVGVVSTVAVEQ